MELNLSAQVGLILTGLVPPKKIEMITPSVLDIANWSEELPECWEI